MKTKSRNVIVVFLMALAFICGVLAITPPTAFANEPEAEITEVTTFNELLNAVNSDKTHIKIMNDIENIVPDDELPTKHRLVFDGGKDYVLNYYVDKNGPVAGVITVQEDDNVFVIADDGVIIRIDVCDIAVQSRYGGGVRTMRLAEGSKVVSIARAPAEEKGEESEETEAVEAEGETAETESAPAEE